MAGREGKLFVSIEDLLKIASHRPKPNQQGDDGLPDDIDNLTGTDKIKLKDKEDK